MRALRGEDFRLVINGIDQLAIKHNSVMLEACNTSFGALPGRSDEFAECITPGGDCSLAGGRRQFSFVAGPPAVA
jgi:hypothetical protein